jgi:NAD(P)-dependent dehydrogenase (short-subunit alcohol dehydrogenase family)
MDDLRGRVAVVTGAASGIGRALARRLAAEGMKLAVGDVEAGPLDLVRAELEGAGAEVLARPIDVADEVQVGAFADAAFARFGAVHLLCNNAGVASRSLHEAAWETPLEDWRWLLGVNLMGVVHGIRAFVPRMLEGGDEGHVVNTASVAGLLGRSGPYHASKSAVVCLSEGLYQDFRARRARLSASVLCPGLIRTAILDAERNRPAAFGPRTDPQSLPAAVREANERFRAALDAGFAPEEVAGAVVDAVRAERFYVIPAQPALVELIRLRLQDIAEQRNPTPVPTPMPANRS